MKIFFAGSIRGGREDAALYGEIITVLKNFGTVLTEINVGNQKLDTYGEGDKNLQGIFQRDVDWLKSADVVIAEVTTPSLGVGYELGRAEALGKPILCLVRPMHGRSLSAMVSGNPYFQLARYERLEDLPEIIEKFLHKKSAGVNPAR